MSIQTDWEKQPMKPEKSKKACMVARMKRRVSNARFGITLSTNRVYEVISCYDDRIVLRTFGNCCLMTSKKNVEIL